MGDRNLQFTRVRRRVSPSFSNKEGPPPPPLQPRAHFEWKIDDVNDELQISIKLYYTWVPFKVARPSIFVGTLSIFESLRLKRIYLY